jgi:hypothetical protein
MIHLHISSQIAHISPFLFSKISSFSSSSFNSKQQHFIHNHKTAGVLLRPLYYFAELRLRLQKTKSRQNPYSSILQNKMPKKRRKRKRKNTESVPKNQDKTWNGNNNLIATNILLKNTCRRISQVERERGSARSRRCLALFEIRCVVSEIAVGDGSVVAGFFFFFFWKVAKLAMIIHRKI